MNELVSGRGWNRTILVTGGCGFIGSAVIRHLIRSTQSRVVNVDKLTYAASYDALEEVVHDPRYTLIEADIVDQNKMEEIIASFKPEVIMHLAAESHVDRSIDGPGDFVRTNVMGTFSLLQAARGYWEKLEQEEKEKFIFHHISTDEVFGALEMDSAPFCETTAYDPRSPYSATKAASDHLVRAWNHTYGLPTLVSNTTNNYGPWQFPEKLIPLITLNALEGKKLPLYGDGSNIRDWLYVDDHAQALAKVALQGKVGETYAIGARSPRSNIDVVRTICKILDELKPLREPRENQIEFVKNRPGHDFRYEIDPTYAENALDWHAEHDFETGIRRTISWYLEHQDWWQGIRGEKYSGQRLGLEKEQGNEQ